MQIEDVAGISFTPRRPTQKQRELPVRHRLLGQIVIDAESVLARISEILTNGHARVRCDKLEWSRLAGRSSDDNGVFHRPVALEPIYDLSDRR